VRRVREEASDPDAVIWAQTEETLHPMYYSLQQAAATETAASVAAARTRIDLLIARLFSGYEFAPPTPPGNSNSSTSRLRRRASKSPASPPC